MTMSRPLALIVAAGTIAGLSTTALAQPEQPKVVNIAGATLLENFFNKRGGTVDYIDVDGDKLARSIPYISGDARRNDQLAPFVLPAANLEGAWPAEAGTGRNIHLAVMYSNIGSTNGFQELINFGRTYTDLPGSNTDPLLSLRSSVRSRAYFNRYRYLVNGSANDDNSAEFPGSAGLIANTLNPMSAPIMNTRDGTFRALYTLPGTKSTNLASGGTADITSQGGLTIDIAPLDVPTTYATTQAGTAALTKNPLEPGYGNNPRLAINADGTITTTGVQGNTLGGQKLAQLTGGANLSATLPGVFNPAADSNTIFDTSIAFAPVSPVVNFGTNIQRFDMSDLQHLFSAGRRITGENLIAVTRDSGSGTRNAWDNSMGRDPSWGVGDNLGPRNNATANERAGAAYLPSNKNSNANVEPCTWNARIAVGYVGPERGLDSSASTWLSSGLMEIAAVRNDIAPYNGTEYSRPTIAEILQYDANGWVIGGPAVLASFGDPLAAPANKGGLGWMEPFRDDGVDGIAGTLDTGENDGVYQVGEPFNDINGNTVRDAAEARPANLNPPMRNPNAAAYLNNIARSLRAFEGSPGSDETLFTPGELLATSFVLIDAMPRIQRVADPLILDPNPTFNANLASFSLANNVYANPAFAAFGNSVRPVSGANSRAGKAPDRTAAATYSDQSVNAFAAVDGSYITEGGVRLQGRATNLPIRNLTAGDFNGDGHRNALDIPQMLGAFRKRAEGAAWSAPSAIPGSYLALEAARAGQAAETGGSDLSIEVIGDFDASGSFDRADLRYFADGLALYAYTFNYNAATGEFAYNGQLDRKQGFIDIDNAYLAAGGANVNVFNTTLVTDGLAGRILKAYAAGDSRGDIAGPGRNPTSPTPLERFRVARGAKPIGFDGTIDTNDIDYVIANLVAANNGAPLANLNPSASAAWSNLNDAIKVDLSADMNGDRVISSADLRELCNTILGVQVGDLNFDGKVNNGDRALITANTGTTPATYSRGDVNGDGVINAADGVTLCVGDFSRDGQLNIDDIFIFLNTWFGSPNTRADISNDNVTNIDDIFIYLNIWFGGCQ